MTERLFDEMLLKLQKACSNRELCTFDIIQKLQRTQLETNLKQKLVTLLQQDGFINDRRYAIFTAETKLRLRKWGRNRIRQFLQQKEIHPEFIEEALHSLSDDTYRSVLYDLLRKKMIILQQKFANKDDVVVRLEQYAKVNGFEEHIIQQTITKLIHEI